MLQLLSLSYIFISFKEVVYYPLIIKFLLNELKRKRFETYLPDTINTKYNIIEIKVGFLLRKENVHIEKVRHIANF